MSSTDTRIPQTSEAVTVLLCGPAQRLRVWAQALGEDGRFQVVSLASTPDDFAAKLSIQPEAVLVDASIFTPQTLIKTMRRVSGVAYVVLPPLRGDALDKARRSLEAIEQVRDVYTVDVNLAVLKERMVGDVRMARQTNIGDAGAWDAPLANTIYRPVSTQVFTVWNLVGGTGKTTTSTSLAREIARRGYKTLLISLGAPDDLALIAGLSAEPNILHWMANPSPEGLKLALQNIDTLDVLAGFPDAFSGVASLDAPPEAPGSVRNLVETAMHMQYAVIILDTMPTERGFPAIMSSNGLILVGTPTLSGVWRTAEAYRTVQERLAGMHRISPERIFVVLNGIAGNEGQLSVGEWHRMASRHVGGSFPPIVAQVPYDAEVRRAHNARRLPDSERYLAGLVPLADAIAGSDMTPKNGRKRGLLRIFGGERS